LARNRILTITGLRRSGKTTLLYQAIEALLKDGVEPIRILYFDVESFLFLGENPIETVLESYSEYSGHTIRDEKIIVFIDEIHQCNGWQYVLKRFFDLKYPVKLIVTGSSSSLLQKDATESLVGRISFIHVFPLSFQEFQVFSARGESLSPVPLTLDFGTLQDQYVGYLDRESIIKNMVMNYITVGGFPEYFACGDDRLWARTLEEDYISLLLYRDIVKAFRIRDPFLIESLLRFIARNATQRFSYSKMSGYLDSDKETIKLYLYYLENSNLCSISTFYTSSGSVSERKEKKIYFCDNGLKNALHPEENAGFLVENAVYLHCRRMLVARGDAVQPWYWTNSRKEEVDIIIPLNDGVIPVEVKFKREISMNELKGICSFMEKFGNKKGIVVTRDLFREEQGIIFLPLWFFLLLSC
jgi:predicted AAA+ superfamily ATPase